ncbi:MAG: Slx4p interacting protein [Alyxoria varia]|nr:MAG: Slx4p interacting protein [Alyxoria varia]
MDRPIPAFYCVYLLRSTKSKTSLYTGSTPNPRRRLKQHNGLVTGGASRTSRAKFRPWRMAIIVTGFPSKIAALQFEWAWQHPHLTRHLRDVEPESEDLRKFMQDFPMKNQKQGPRSLSGKLLSLVSLLRAQSFSRWPLQVDLFDPEAADIWQKRVKRSASHVTSHVSVRVHGDAGPNASSNPNPVRNNERSHGSGQDAARQPEIDALDVSFQPYKAHVQKSFEALSQDPAPCCTLCELAAHHDKGFALTCSSPGCSMVAHMGCLADNFLREETNQERIVPVQGTCPKCRTNLLWANLTRDLTLRMRGKADLERLFRQPRKRNNGDPKVDSELTPDHSDSNFDDGEECTDEEDNRNETRSECVEISRASATTRKSLPNVIANSDYDDIDELSE